MIQPHKMWLISYDVNNIYQHFDVSAAHKNYLCEGFSAVAQISTLSISALCTVEGNQCRDAKNADKLSET